MSYEQYRPNKFNLLPPVIKNLLIINGLFFLATIVFAQSGGLDILDKFGLHFPTSEKFQPYQIITYMFLHGGIMHIFFNMFALWMFGNTLENVWGQKRFLIYYLVTGIGAAVCHYTVAYFFDFKPVLEQISSYPGYLGNEYFVNFLNNLPLLPAEAISIEFREMVAHYNEIIQITPDSSELPTLTSEIIKQYRTDFLNAPVVVGASGSVFGVLLAFGMMFPNTIIYIYFAIPMKAKWFVLLYGAVELFSGLKGSPGDNVAHFAHLGGMLFGYLLIKYWQKNKTRFY